MRIKRCLVTAIMVFICFILESTVFQALEIADVTPNLLVVLTTVAGFMYGRKFGMYTGFIAGLLVDVMYGNTIGTYMLIFVIIGYLNGMVNKVYYKEALLIPMISIAVSDLLAGLLFFICGFLLRGRLNLPVYLMQVIIPEVVYTTIMGYFLYKLYRWINDSLYLEPEVPIE